MPAPVQPPPTDTKSLNIAIDRAEALLDGLLEAYVAHHRARVEQESPTAQPLDVGRRRIVDAIGQTRMTIDRLKTLAEEKTAKKV